MSLFLLVNSHSVVLFFYTLILKLQSHNILVIRKHCVQSPSHVSIYMQVSTMLSICICSNRQFTNNKKELCN